MSDFELFNYVNGSAASTLSVRDRGLAYGDGLFETMRLESGRIPLWPFHFDRLLQSCKRLRIPLDPDLIHSDLNSLLAKAKANSVARGVVKLIVTRGVGGRGYRSEDNPHPNRVLTLSPLPSIPDCFVETGVRVYLCRHRLPDNPPLAGLKHLNKLDYVMASQEWSAGEFQEGLLLSSSGELVEACSRNVFVVRDGVLFTPHLEQAGVAGVLRRRIMEKYAAEMGLAVTETSMDVDFIAKSGEMFLTNSITGVWPVKELVGEGVGELQFSSIETGRRLQQQFITDLGLGRSGDDA